ncbi:chemotaxis protein CheW [Telmatocola sphagniphila]|uniref:Chemotaxis protein CheW n=1 Tax=Telmatocola sphagniphila TaxID=1123043 RepID=A0A8E6BAH3_9BACT|nr:chemotaxis protein CheW [Telmatocola sphagniphila]QVL33558.1 chemotaxis protein CheW [Telmatocola sphagniphila]
MADESQFCTFRVGDLYLGVDVMRVQEIIRYQEVTPVPLAHPVVRGLINLRGQIVTAIDLRRRLDLPAKKNEDSEVNVVVQTEDGAISLLVDEIGDVLTVSSEDFERPPESLRESARELIRGTYKLPEKLLLILDVEQAVLLPNGSKDIEHKL